MVYEFENKDGYISYLDDDGYFTCQLPEDDVVSIVSKITPHIKSKSTVEVEVKSVDGGLYKLVLSWDDDLIYLNGRYHENDTDINGSYLNDFEVEGVSIDDWNDFSTIIDAHKNRLDG